MKQNLFKRSLISMTTILAMILAVTVSCSDDDDNDNGTTPDAANSTELPYESVAAKYEITTEGAPYKSIEFTADGKYIIEKNVDEYDAKPSIRKAKKNISTRADADDIDDYIILGDYDYTEVSGYDLKDIGTIKITKSEDGSYYDIIITDKNGKDITEYEGARVEDRIPVSEKTRLFCRTWTTTNLEITVTRDGEEFFHWSGDPSKYDEINQEFNNTIESKGLVPSDHGSDVVADDEYLANVSFTRTGSYIAGWKHKNYPNVVYEDIYWRWYDEDKNIFAESGGTPYTDEDWNTFNTDFWEEISYITFNGNTMTMTYRGENVCSPGEDYEEYDIKDKDGNPDKAVYKIVETYTFKY